MGFDAIAKHHKATFILDSFRVVTYISVSQVELVTFVWHCVIVWVVFVGQSMCGISKPCIHRTRVELVV